MFINRPRLLAGRAVCLKRTVLSNMGKLSYWFKKQKTEKLLKTKLVFDSFFIGKIKIWGEKDAFAGKIFGRVNINICLPEEEFYVK